MDKEFQLKDLLVIGEPRLMESRDLPAVFALFKKQQAKYDFQLKLSQAELQHHLMCEGVVTTIVFEQSNKVVDFVSFYIDKKTTPKEVADSLGPFKVSSNILIFNFISITERRFVLLWLDPHRELRRYSKIRNGLRQRLS